VNDDPQPGFSESSMTADSGDPQITSRPMQSDEDFWRVRRLLVDTHPFTPVGFNWEVRRWDGWRFHTADPTWNPEWERVTCLWQTGGGDLVAAAHPEGKGDVHLQVHPDFRHLEAVIIAWAEEHLAVRTETGRRRHLDVMVFEYDAVRRGLLHERGYRPLPGGGFTHVLRLGDESFPAPTMPDGYVLRTTRPTDSSDCEQIAALLNAAFDRDFHTAGEYRNFASHAPCFHPDLDLVAVAPDSSFASYVGAPYDEVNRLGIFEPVCTHPAHLRRGLARALMGEALRRLQALGADVVQLGTGDAEAANRAYEAVGFRQKYREERWRKTF
jgi:GNAT superfamily N-acetyltransferase